MFLGTDGGVALTVDGSSSWVTINGQMEYCTGLSYWTVDFSIQIISSLGIKDNGTNLLNGTTWKKFMVAMVIVLLIGVYNTLVESYVNGDFNRSTNGGNNWTSISTGLTGSLAWVAPIIQSPHDANTYYCSWDRFLFLQIKEHLGVQMGTLTSLSILFFSHII